MRLRLVVATVVVLIAAACAESSTTTDETTEVAPSTTGAPTSTTTGAPTSTTTVTPTTTEPSPATTQAEAESESPCTRVTDFDTTDWFVVNDGVMGGRSEAGGGIADGVLTWTGTIVTQGGGFSSIRGPIDGQLEAATELQLRIRTDGRPYELLADDSASARVTHYNPIEASGGEWEVVTVPLSGMEPRIFGSLVTADPFDPDRATQIGVILADGVDGDFSFDIDWIDACV